MSKTFAAFFGAVAGIIVVPFTLFMLDAENLSTETELLIGIGIGGFAGAIIGSIGGDISRQSDAQGLRPIVGFVAGALTGVYASLNYTDVAYFLRDMLN